LRGCSVISKFLFVLFLFLLSLILGVLLGLEVGIEDAEVNSSNERGIYVDQINLGSTKAENAVVCMSSLDHSMFISDILDVAIDDHAIIGLLGTFLVIADLHEILLAHRDITAGETEDPAMLALPTGLAGNLTVHANIDLGSSTDVVQIQLPLCVDRSQFSPDRIQSDFVVGQLVILVDIGVALFIDRINILDGPDNNLVTENELVGLCTGDVSLQSLSGIAYVFDVEAFTIDDFHCDSPLT